jgi:DNA processing protein
MVLGGFMDELEIKLFWHLLPQCSNAVLLKIQEEFGALPEPGEFLQDTAVWIPETLKRKVQSQLRNPSNEFATALTGAQEFLSNSGLGCIERGDTDYPALLDKIPDPPAMLYFRGALASIHNPQIAIVGSRACSRSGQRDAKDFSAHLSRSGFAITSGLALGIDTAAHLGALENQGATVAVTGSGLDKVYPARNRALANRIVEANGLLLSEFPPGTPPRRENFPQRNRIISGLALATLVVEASDRSGSLITARLALEQGREVMVLPGSIHDPLKNGCHRLIRDGAALVDSVDQIVELIGGLLGFQFELLHEESTQNLPNKVAPVEHRIQQLFEQIEFEPISFEDLLEVTKLETLELAELLTSLELEGLVERNAKGVSRIK